MIPSRNNPADGATTSPTDGPAAIHPHPLESGLRELTHHFTSCAGQPHQHPRQLAQNPGRLVPSAPRATARHGRPGLVCSNAIPERQLADDLRPVDHAAVLAQDAHHSVPPDPPPSRRGHRREHNTHRRPEGPLARCKKLSDQVVQARAGALGVIRPERSLTSLEPEMAAFEVVALIRCRQKCPETEALDSHLDASRADHGENTKSRPG